MGVCVAQHPLCAGEQRLWILRGRSFEDLRFVVGLALPPFFRLASTSFSCSRDKIPPWVPMWLIGAVFLPVSESSVPAVLPGECPSSVWDVFPYARFGLALFAHRSILRGRGLPEAAVVVTSLASGTERILNEHMAGQHEPFGS